MIHPSRKLGNKAASPPAPPQEASRGAAARRREKAASSPYHPCTVISSDDLLSAKRVPPPFRKPLQFIVMSVTVVIDATFPIPVGFLHDDELMGSLVSVMVIVIEKMA
jgi:hypothetical protein